MASAGGCPRPPPPGDLHRRFVRRSEVRSATERRHLSLSPLRSRLVVPSQIDSDPDDTHVLPRPSVPSPLARVHSPHQRCCCPHTCHLLTIAPSCAAGSPALLFPWSSHLALSQRLFRPSTAPRRAAAHGVLRATLHNALSQASPHRRSLIHLLTLRTWHGSPTRWPVLLGAAAGRAPASGALQFLGLAVAARLLACAMWSALSPPTPRARACRATR